MIDDAHSVGDVMRNNIVVGEFRLVLCADIEIYNWDGQTVLFAHGLF
jgi:hypothetical protein